jgi:hypothetical protein
VTAVGFVDANGVVQPVPDVLSPTAFRAVFPAFRDQQTYSDGEIMMYADFANQTLDPARWPQPWRNMGMALFIAHYLILSQRDQNAAASGAVPGSPISGVFGSKSVGGVSVGLDTSIGVEQGAGFWASTSFGGRFYHLMKLVGMGGSQLGGNLGDIRINGPGWPGVIHNDGF